MNHKKFGKLLTEISKMTKKHFSPSQVIALTEKFSDPVVVKHDVIEVINKKPRGRPKKTGGGVPSGRPKKSIVANTVTLSKQKAKPKIIKQSDEDNAVKHVLAKLCKEPIDLYDGTVFQCLMGFAGSISITGLKKKLSLTGDEVRLQASLYKGMNRKVVGRTKVQETNMYFTVIENLPIMKSIITRINGGGSK